MSIDDILDAYAKSFPGEWAVRKTVDDSGDYEFPTYDIVSIMPYGPRQIGTAFQEPYNAIMFAGAKQLAEEVKRLRAEVLGLKGPNA